MGDRIWPVTGFGSNGVGQLVVKESTFGKVVDSVTVDAGEVWEIDWADGSKDLWLYAPESIGHQIDHQA